METFAMVLVSIVFWGIFVGFIYLAAKGADKLIKRLKEMQVYTPPETIYEADIEKKLQINKSLIKVIMKLFGGI